MLKTFRLAGHFGVTKKAMAGRLGVGVRASMFLQPVSPRRKGGKQIAARQIAARTSRAPPLSSTSCPRSSRILPRQQHRGPLRHPCGHPKQDPDDRLRPAADCAKPAARLRCSHAFRALPAAVRPAVTRLRPAPEACRPGPPPAGLANRTRSSANPSPEECGGSGTIRIRRFLWRGPNA